ncbi:hypothetical protein C1645_116547, partial [Glomus cerebriforme]
MKKEDPISSSKSFTQNETEMNINKNDSDSNNNIDLLNKQFYELTVKQANEFEEFGKQMSLELRNFYKEYSARQNESLKMETKFVEMEKVVKKFEEQIDSQSQLIDSLKARIEELETDSLIKNQDIKQLQNELKVLAVPAAQDNEGSVSLATNENGEDLEIKKSNDQINKKSMADDSSEIFVYYEKEESNNEKLIDDDDENLSIDDDDDDNFVYPNDENLAEPETSHLQYSHENYEEEPSTIYQDTNYQDSSSTTYQKYNKDYSPTSYQENYVPSTSYQQYNDNYYDNDVSYQQQYNDNY